MFYSQFILAKKGPLGTIWIAAHLERKLRKNQVADTDIGESVDSILFPDVPIALRLSSHLLLGVVRIYSRKVNYLFHDCSEALLKIKQAFRSTAVDLPPEESTAPYHSITLPETFDLDDFELPDSVLLSGNFVDHHVSTREQITLQDTVDATGYSTSQFGLDERFGDGDASQIRLDLDEDVTLEKESADNDISNLLDSGDVEHQIPGQPETPFPDVDMDGCHNDYEEEQNGGTAKDIPEHFADDLGRPGPQNVQDLREEDLSSHGHNVQTPYLHKGVSHGEHAISPSAVDIPEHFADGLGRPGPQNVQDLMEEDLSSHGHNVQTPYLHKGVSHGEHAISPSAVDIPEHFADGLGRPGPQNAQDLREEDLSSHGHNVQTPYLHKGVSHGEHAISPSAVQDDLIVSCPMDQILPDSTENAQAPSTPGLMQEAIPANVQENPALSPSGKASPSNDMEAIVPNATHRPHMESECHDPNENDVVPLSMSDHSLTQAERLIPTCGDLLETNGELVKDISESCALGSQDPAGAADACQDNATLASNSGSSFRPCNTKMDQAIIPYPVDGTSDLLPKGPVLSALDFTDGKEQLHVGGSSVEMQDADTDINWKSGQVHSQDEAGFSKDDALPNLISKDARLETNCSASSEYPEPERMLFATGGEIDAANDLGQCTTAEKGVAESDGSVDRTKSTQPSKRCLAESTPVLLSGNSPKSSRVSQLGRNTDYIPDDDDLLASILVGRTPALKMKPTPTLPTMPPSKRPRLSARVGVPKRKVLLDDTMVLHADAIRQQLINTEDIRRTRRKAPCTNSEIWIIQKCSQEEEIFSEPVLTGMCMELAVLDSRANDLNEIPDLQLTKSSHHVEISNIQNPGNSEFVEEAKVDQIENINATITENSGGERQEFTDVLQSPKTVPSSFGCDADEQRESLQDTCQPKLSSGDHQCPIISTEPDASNVVNIGTQEPLLSTVYSGDECQIPANAITETQSIDKQKGADEMNNELPLHENHQSFLESSQFCEELGEMNAKLKVKVSSDDMLIFTEEACTAGDASLSCPKGSDVDACKAVTDDVMVSMVDNCSTEVEAAFLNDPSVLGADCIQGVEQIREGNVDSGVDGEVVADKVKDDNGKPTSEHVLVNVPQDSQPTSTGVEDNPSAVVENSSVHDVMEMESSHFDSTAPRDYVQDFCSAIGGNDTDFLNVDDEVDFDEEVDNEVPNTEETQSMENSGWSTRTRGVARYLRSLFDDESGLRKTTVAMDHLLAGKTRKEASRMFFETLVLKTKDYIHVEQENSFRNINIKPRSKLLKSEF